MEPAKQNYLSQIAHDITRHVIAPAKPIGVRKTFETSLSLGNFSRLFQEYRFNEEMGAYRNAEVTSEIRVLLGSLIRFEALRRAIYKLKDQPVFQNSLDDEEENALRMAEDIITPAERYFERMSERHETALALPLRCVLENREPTELELVEALSNQQKQQDAADSKSKEFEILLKRYRDFKLMVYELRDAYFSGDKR